jgi:hypothetical protein
MSGGWAEVGAGIGLSLVLPVAWVLVLRAVRRLTSQDPASGATTTDGLATVTIRDHP